MKKLVLGSLIASAVLYADVATVLPYFGKINYDSAPEKSLKDSANFGGIYTSIGDLGYLLEFSYNYLDIAYKDTLGIENLKQHDLTLIYSKYYTHFMLKGGIHYINNNEQESFRDLGSGFVGIVGLSGYKWDETSKTTGGIDIYYSYYGSAHNDISALSTTTVNLWQFTPYIQYANTITPKLSNSFTLKGNMIRANDYTDSYYFSYEFSDTLTYEGFYVTLGFLGGDMKSGVRDNGFSVYNTKDLYSNTYTAKAGYYFTPNFTINLSYTINDYKEYNAATLQLLPEGRNSIAYASLSYTF